MEAFSVTGGRGRRLLEGQEVKEDGLLLGQELEGFFKLGGAVFRSIQLFLEGGGSRGRVLLGLHLAFSKAHIKCSTL